MATRWGPGSCELVGGEPEVSYAMLGILCSGRKWLNSLGFKALGWPHSMLFRRIGYFFGLSTSQNGYIGANY